MTVALIAAMSENRVIGIGNRLPWRLPADLRRFKQTTWGHTLILGRKTFESIGKPLPGRRMIVLSQQAGYQPQGVTTAASLDAALAEASGESEVFIAGGATVYEQSLAICKRLYLTIIHQSFVGDAFFPEVDWSHWGLSRRELRFPDPINRYCYTFEDWDRATDGLARCGI